MTKLGWTWTVLFIVQVAFATSTPARAETLIQRNPMLCRSLSPWERMDTMAKAGDHAGVMRVLDEVMASGECINAPSGESVTVLGVQQPFMARVRRADGSVWWTSGSDVWPSDEVEQRVRNWGR